MKMGNTRSPWHYDGPFEPSKDRAVLETAPAPQPIHLARELVAEFPKQRWIHEVALEGAENPLLEFGSLDRHPVQNRGRSALERLLPHIHGRCAHHRFRLI
jgi:hypothetical protein